MFNGRIKNIFTSVVNKEKQNLLRQFSKSVKFSKLSNRTLLELNGPDSSEFLQGICTNDMTTLEKGNSLYAAFLTSKSKIISDSIISRISENTFIVEAPQETSKSLQKLFKIQKLRKKFNITDVSAKYSAYQILVEPHSSFLNQLTSYGYVTKDPRSDLLGYKVLLNTEASDENKYLSENFTLFDYEGRRLSLGIGEGLEIKDMFPLEANFEYLNGVSFDKGCYTGQELVARTNFRGVVRKRLFPISSVQDSYEQNKVLEKVSLLYKGKKVGHMKTPRLAVIRLDPQGKIPSELLEGPLDTTEQNISSVTLGKVPPFLESLSLSPELNSK
eukprot:maker-scaffold_1-snap-gene-3.0-mRNA-1 protein AED:0.52 eAED:0.52 QI:0/0/0/0.5/1/1/2/0/329